MMQKQRYAGRAMQHKRRKKCCATKQIAYVLCHGERMRPVSCPLSSSCPQAPNLQASSTPAPGWVAVQHPGGTINNSDSITIGCADRITKPHDLSVHLNVATTEHAGVVAYHGGVSMTAWESSAPSVDNLAIVPIFPFQTHKTSKKNQFKWPSSLQLAP